MLKLAEQYIKTDSIIVLQMYKKVDILNSKIKLLEIKTIMSEIKNTLDGINSN